jgi:hypothetical protein
MNPMTTADLPVIELPATEPIIEAPMPYLPVSSDDEQHLESYEAKLQLVRDYTKGVALGFSNGFFLYGTGGIAKSYTVLGELQRLSVDFKLFNSRMSGRGFAGKVGSIPERSCNRR